MSFLASHLKESTTFTFVTTTYTVSLRLRLRLVQPREY